jgi:ankyrin repeat protein
MSALFEAIKNHNIKQLKILLDSGVNPNYQDEYGVTPLHEAVEYESSNSIDLLLQYESDLTIKDDNGATPLLQACISDNTRIAKLLLSNGANPNTNDKFGSALQCAVVNNNPELVEELIRYNVDLNPRKPNGSIPLHTASKHGDDEIVKLLLKSDINAVNNKGETPLHKAVKGAHMATVELLLEAGPDPTIENNEGRTPRELAEELELFGIARVLSAYDESLYIKEPDY